MIVSEQLNYIKTRRFHAIFMSVIIEFSRCIGTYSSAKFELDKKTISLTAKGEQETLTATVEPEGADQSVTWSSSNEEVATVENGTVTAVGHGTATITATSAADPTKTETATVTVTITGGGENPVPVTGVKLDNSNFAHRF